MLSKYLITASFLLVLTHAHAADPAACQTSMQRLSDERELSALVSDDPDAIIFEVGEVEAVFGAQPTAAE